MQSFPSNNIINSLLPVISNDIPYLIVFTNSVGFSISLEDIPECPAYRCEYSIVEELRDNTYLIALLGLDPASLRTNARRWSIKFQYFSAPLHS